MRGDILGTYVIAGGGWYNRYNKLSTRVTPGAGIACTTPWRWWGFACESGAVKANQANTSTSSNTLGGNVGAGFTIRTGEEPYRFYVEARYHYAPSEVIHTQFVTVAVGFRY